MSTKFYLQKLLLSCIVIISLAIATTAEAAYKPPAKPSRPKTATGSTSTRSTRGYGCSGTARTTLTALAPLSHFGQTVSTQPTFAWFVPDVESHLMEFSLYEYGTSGKGKFLKKINLQSSSGIMQLSLAKENYRLSIGQKYLWQIALLCNPNRPSQDLVAAAVIEVVAMPPPVTNALAQTKEPLKQAELYAEAGLWYDAISLTLGDRNNKASSLKFLTQLSKLEASAATTSEYGLKKSLQQQALQLEQIASMGY
ncbi:DUF928 domain-containing protein [Iningainema tapete]|uniref:DUF928 domain-containing protein n=1 Tax=Iningainema tapete BLCC-T55 TaxID=2748662 RepID=A0A8J6XHI0_9CYAN|nr:DUF928 domain-containing protein [Iningainema tapete]MBD2776915.1 DUF928 domain-containing protein [Iningainema tapete BLCC-T55]